MATPKRTRNPSARKSKCPTTPTSAPTLSAEEEQLLRREGALWSAAAWSLELAAEAARKIADHYDAGGNETDRRLYLAVCSMPGLVENAREHVLRVAGREDSQGLAQAAALALYEWAPGKAVRGERQALATEPSAEVS